MHKTYTLIACLTLGMVGCAASVKQVDLYGGNLSFKIRNDAKDITVKNVLIDGCMYQMGGDNSPMRRSCPLVTRLHNTKNDTTIQIMDFPVTYETFVMDYDLFVQLEKYFEQPFREQGNPVKGQLTRSPIIAMQDLTWPNDKRGVWKERVVIFRAIDKSNKEHSVFMVGHCSESNYKEMIMIQDFIIVDIRNSANKK